MSAELPNLLRVTVALDLFAVVALVLTVVRGGVVADVARRRAAARIAVVAVLVQTLHFAEELATELYVRFPELLGLDPVSEGAFVRINDTALAIWLVSIPALQAGYRAALFPLWFLGVACVANGFLHPVAALLTGGYFPGLVTSLPALAIGVLLLRELVGATEGPRSVRDSPP